MNASLPVLSDNSSPSSRGAAAGDQARPAHVRARALVRPLRPVPAGVPDLHRRPATKPTSPRGRIQLMLGLADGKIEPTPFGPATPRPLPRLPRLRNRLPERRRLSRADRRDARPLRRDAKTAQPTAGDGFMRWMFFNVFIHRDAPEARAAPRPRHAEARPVRAAAKSRRDRRCSRRSCARWSRCCPPTASSGRSRCRRASSIRRQRLRAGAQPPATASARATADDRRLLPRLHRQR